LEEINSAKRFRVEGKTLLKVWGLRKHSAKRLKEKLC
jgi:hypothetical protein